VKIPLIVGADLSVAVAVPSTNQDAEKRYRGYFGKRIGTVSQSGLEGWVDTELHDWL